MMNVLIALGLGIIIFALIAGVGIVILQNFAQATASCATGYAYEKNSSGYDFANQLCCKANTPSCNAIGTNSTSPSAGAQTVNTTSGYITSNLITWIPAVIALGIGLLFIGALMGRKNKY